MKACIVIQNQYGKLGHAIALHLKEKYGVTDFCAYLFSTGAQEFIRRQTDIPYDPILVDHELHAQYKNEPIDLEYIRRFDETYTPPHLWHYLYTDRKLMMSIGPKEETTAIIDPLYNHEDLMRIFQVRARAIEKMLLETKPDFIFFFAIGALAHLILFHVAKKLGIRTFNIDFPRIGNLISLSGDYNTLTGAEDIFRSLQKEHIKIPEHTKAEEFLERFRKTGSLELEYLEVDMAVNPGNDDALVPKNPFKSIQYLGTLARNYFRNRGIFLYGMTDLNPLRFILYKCKQRYRKWQGIEDLYSAPQEEDYAFFPLHYEPELATLLLSPFYFDQIALIRLIARSLPLHFKLYVKEHPAMVFKRSKSFYGELLKIPNVKLISHKVKSADLIKNAKLITVITGTVGWEACLLEKPVITFGEVFFNTLSFVKRVRNIETLPTVVNDQLNHFAYNKEEMLNLLAAVFKDSIPFDFTKIWFETDPHKLKDEKGVNLLCEYIVTHCKQNGQSTG